MVDGELCARPLTFPARPDNRPAVSRIGYRIGTYSDFREHLMRRLDATPALAHWTHREPDDPGIALLECAAVLGDILTFYQDLYANEVYLRTAGWRSSVAELVRLVGYRLAPGLGGSATFAVELRPGGPVTVPAGFALKVELQGGDDPATFETQADLVAQPELSRFNLHRPLTEPQVTAGATELWLRADRPLDLAPDDRILLGAPEAGAPDRLADTQMVVVEEVTALHGATIVRIGGAVQRDYAAGVVAYRLGRSFRHFGHNAPAQEVRVTDNDDGVTATDVDYCRSLVGLTSIGSGTLAALDVPIDVAVDDLPAGREVICSYVDCLARTSKVLYGGEHYLVSQSSGGETHKAVGIVDGSPFQAGTPLLAGAPQIPETVVRTVTQVDAASLRVGSLTGSSTVLGLDRELSTGAKAGADIRTFAIHEVTGPRMEVHARPVDRDEATGRELYLHAPASVAALLEGRRLLLAPPDGEAVATVASVVDVDTPAVAGMADLHRVTLAADVDYARFPQEPGEASSIVFGNLVDADQGETTPEVAIGSGDNRSAFQTFELPKAPLTYHQAPSLTPPRAPGLAVAVAGRTWARVESLFGQGPDAEVYIVREDNDGSSWVQFGDGARGARLPSGVDNVSARFRTGAGAHGPLKAEARVQTGRLERLEAIQLPGVASGGAEPEEADVARAAAPGRVQSLDRLVALADFEHEALATAGVALASATWSLAEGVPTVTVTVLMDGGREDEHAAVAAALRLAARERGPDRFEVDVLQGEFLDVQMEAEVAVESGLDPEAVLAGARDALGVERPDAGRPADGLFSLPRRRFGEGEHQARVTGVIQNVAGVAWVRMAGFGAAGKRGPVRALACPPGRVLRLLEADCLLTAVAPVGSG